MSETAKPPEISGADELKAIYRISRGAFVSTAVFSSMVNILMLTGPLFMLQIYDRVLASGSVPTLVALSAIVIVLYAYYGFLEYLRARLLVRIGRRVEERLRDRVFDIVAGHALRRTPGIGAQPVNDLAAIRQYLSGQGPFAFLDMPWVPAYLGIIFLMHWMLGVASLFAALAIFMLAVLSERATREPMAEALRATLKASTITDEGRRNAEALHALGMVGALRSRWSAAQQTALDHQTIANDAGGGLGAASRVLRLMVQSGILALGAYFAIRHEISSGSMIAASIIMSRALAPVEQAVANWQQFLGFRKARERLTGLLNAVPVRGARMALPRPRGKLDVENLTVQLPNVEKPLLQGVSFSVAPGEGIGVIGPTGAGKSTLARALVGIIAPVRGHVRIDGATLDQRDPDALGRLIGYLPQDVQLFDGTVMQNIARFDAQASPGDVLQAAKLANVHDLIMRLPDGYHTPLGENGSRLSAGQRQRMALARAMYGDPVLFVLDEPNSNLDDVGETALVKAVQDLKQQGKTVFLITHRMSIIGSADRILVLYDGVIQRYGPRQEVIAALQPKAAPQGNASGGAVNPSPNPAPQPV